MRRSAAIELLSSHAGELRPAGVAHASLFGSLARDQLGPLSDIDLVLDGPADRPMTLFSMARAEALLEAIFRRSVDLTARQGLDGAPLQTSHRPPISSTCSDRGVQEASAHFVGS